MTRLAIIAPKAAQTEIIEALHGSRATHLETYAQGTHEELDIGEPTEDASRDSQTLVRLRAIRHALALSGEPSEQIDRDELRARLDAEIEGIDGEVRAAVRMRDEAVKALESLRDRRSQLLPLVGLPLELGDLSGYERLRVFVGTTPRDLRADLSRALARYEYFVGPQAHVVFADARVADKAAEVLASEGFRDLDIPEGAGTIEANLRELDEKERELRGKRHEADARLAALAREHRDLILAADEELSIAVEKGEAPLGFASTERSFIVDCWVPTSDLDDVKTTVDRAAGGVVHFETTDTGVRAVERESSPPTKYQHPPGVRPFGFLLDIFSRPKYDEIDPTAILFLVFPLFFGFMIGDLGYGVLMVALGLYLYRKVGAKSDGARSLGFALLLAGIWATAFGAIVFHDAFGIPFAAHGEHADALSWEGLLGLHFGLGDPIFNKLGDAGVKSMLALSILAAFVHLLLGFLFGFINEIHHDKKHALAKLGWMGVLVAFFLVALVMSPGNVVGNYFVELLGLADPAAVAAGSIEIADAGLGLNVALAFLVPGVLILILTEGAMGAIEVLGLLSNVISYTRLAGVAVAKGAMAGAFNFIFLEGMVLGGAGIVTIVVGFLLFVLAQLIVFVLGLISSAIQGIRLNYVEFFLKFYHGGGRTFTPFGRQRKFTTEAI